MNNKPITNHLKCALITSIKPIFAHGNWGKTWRESSTCTTIGTGSPDFDYIRSQGLLFEKQ